MIRYGSAIQKPRSDGSEGGARAMTDDEDCEPEPSLLSVLSLSSSQGELNPPDSSSIGAIHTRHIGRRRT